MVEAAVVHGGAAQGGGQWGPPAQGGGGQGRDAPDIFNVGDGGTGAPWTGWSPANAGSTRFGAGGGASAYNSPSASGGPGGQGGGGSGAVGGSTPNDAGIPPMGSQGHPGRNHWGSGGGGGERNGTGGGHGGDGVVIVAYDASPTDFCTERTASTKEIVATGGFISEHLNPDGVSIDRVHMFSAFNSLSSGQASQQFIVSSGSGTANLLLVGGGGGGGSKGGGGGGGQVVTGSVALTAQTYIVLVGPGGTGDMSNEETTGTQGATSPGGNTTFGPPGTQNLFGAGGGGKGGSDSTPTDSHKNGGDGYLGGSGGGVAGGGYGYSSSAGTGGTTNPSPNPGVTTYQSNGGIRGSSPHAPANNGGGGGGAGSTGHEGGDNPGNGGIGVQVPLFDMYGTNASNSIAGSTSRGYYGAGGGGGGDGPADAGSGGAGGGGFGANPTTGWAGTRSSPAWSAATNRGRSGYNGTGGGGGGGSNNTSYGIGGDGGDGIFCIRYKYISN